MVTRGPHLVTAPARTAKALLVGMQVTKSPSYIFPSSKMTKKLVDTKYLSKENDPTTVSSLPLLPDPPVAASLSTANFSGLHLRLATPQYFTMRVEIIDGDPRSLRSCVTEIVRYS